jgi:hypothetical protein
LYNKLDKDISKLIKHRMKRNEYGPTGYHRRGCPEFERLFAAASGW